MSVLEIRVLGDPILRQETRVVEQVTDEHRRLLDDMFEKMHAIEVSEPLVAGNSIAFRLEMDMTMKGKGRMKSPELCVYQVKDGKIIEEEFFV